MKPRIKPFVVETPNKEIFNWIKALLESKGYSVSDYDNQKNIGNGFPGGTGSLKVFGMIYYDYNDHWLAKAEYFNANQLEEFRDWVEKELTKEASIV